MLDASGRVIGVADQIATGGSADANTGVGFATPIDLVKAELADLEAGRDVSHAFLGVGHRRRRLDAGAAVGSVSRRPGRVRRACGRATRSSPWTAPPSAAAATSWPPSPRTSPATR